MQFIVFSEDLENVLNFTELSVNVFSFYFDIFLPLRIIMFIKKICLSN